MKDSKMVQYIALIPDPDGAVIFEAKGQPFRFIGLSDHTTPTGKQVPLLNFETRCKSCGAAFTFGTTRRMKLRTFCPDCFERLRNDRNRKRLVTPRREPPDDLIISAVANATGVHLYLSGGPEPAYRILQDYRTELAEYHPLAIRRKLASMLASGALAKREIGRNAYRKSIRSISLPGIFS